MRANSSDFSEAYPGLLDDQKLGQVTKGRPVLVAIETRAEGIALLFGSVRWYERREPLALQLQFAA